MKTRSCFELHSDGVVYCNSGTLSDFITDIVTCILPILYDSIYIVFNDKKIKVSKDDTIDSIFEKWRNAPYQN